MYFPSAQFTVCRVMCPWHKFMLAGYFVTFNCINRLTHWDLSTCLSESIAHPVFACLSLVHEISLLLFFSLTSLGRSFCDTGIIIAFSCMVNSLVLSFHSVYLFDKQCFIIHMMNTSPIWQIYIHVTRKLWTLNVTFVFNRICVRRQQD